MYIYIYTCYYPTSCSYSLWGNFLCWHIPERWWLFISIYCYSRGWGRLVSLTCGCKVHGIWSIQSETISQSKSWMEFGIMLFACLNGFILAGVGLVTTYLFPITTHRFVDIRGSELDANFGMGAVTMKIRPSLTDVLLRENPVSPSLFCHPVGTVCRWLW